MDFSKNSLDKVYVLERRTTFVRHIVKREQMKNYAETTLKGNK